jgi:DNA-binding HxlR family transcriptional regulator
METMKKNRDCHSVEKTLQVIGGKWKPIILYHLSQDKQRFSALQRAVSGITQKMLTQQLRQLEADGLVSRHVYPQVPPKVEYALTPRGVTLLPILQDMAVWGSDSQK